MPLAPIQAGGCELSRGFRQAASALTAAKGRFVSSERGMRESTRRSINRSRVPGDIDEWFTAIPP